MQIKGKTAVVTGAGRGVGESLANLLLEKGANVVGIDRQINERETENSLFLQADITNEEQMKEVLAKLKAKFGSADILINNAARQTVASFEDTTVEDFRAALDVNLTGPFICTKVFLEAMGEGSSILNMLSVHYEVPRLDKFGYDASKAGLAMLTKETALALAERGITCNGMAIGAAASPMNGDWLDDPESVSHVKDKIPMRWIATCEEIAQYAISILEAFADHATGSIFTVDGGRSLK